MNDLNLPAPALPPGFYCSSCAATVAELSRLRAEHERIGDTEGLAKAIWSDGAETAWDSTPEKHKEIAYRIVDVLQRFVKEGK